MNTSAGYLERRRGSGDNGKAGPVSVVRVPADSQAPLVSSYFTAQSTGVQAEKSWLQLANGYKSWVYTCVDKIAKSVARIPLRLYVYRSKSTQKIIRDVSWKATYRELKDEKERSYFMKDLNLEREEIFDHPFIQLLTRPNDFMTRFILWYNTIIRLELGGLCNWLKIKDGSGFGIIRQIYPLPLTKFATMAAKVSPNMSLDYWDYQDGNVKRQFKPDEIFTMLYPNPSSPFQGMSPLMAQVYPYDIDLYLMQQQKALFEHGAVPGLHMTTDQSLTREQVEEIKAQINDQYAGAVKSGETLITHSGLKADRLGQTGREAAIAVVSQFARDKLITAFDTSPGILGLVEDVNRANGDFLTSMWYQTCIQPKCMIIEESIETFLLPDYDQGLTCDFDLPDIEDKDYRLKERETNLKTKYSTINEEREKEGLDPVDWGDAPWGSSSDWQVGEERPTSASPFGAPPNPDDSPPVKPGKEKPPKKTDDFFSHESELTPDQWTVDAKNVYWEKSIARADRMEGTMTPVLRRYFKAQLEEMITRLNREGRKVLGQYNGWSRQKVLAHLKDHKANLEAININKAHEEKSLKRIFTPIVKNILGFSGNERMRYFLHVLRHKSITEWEEKERALLHFNVNDPAVEKWLGERMSQFSNSITGTTFDEVESILRDGFAAGESIVTISDKLRQKFDEYEGYRASLIARTETMSALNKADIESVYQLGVEERLSKFWLSARDGKCRDTHEAADKDYQDGIPIDDNFKVGEDSMPCPGNGSKAEENINCRCVLGYLEVTE